MGQIHSKKVAPYSYKTYHGLWHKSTDKSFNSKPPPTIHIINCKESNASKLGRIVCKNVDLTQLGF